MTLKTLLVALLLCSCFLIEKLSASIQESKSLKAGRSVSFPWHPLEHQSDGVQAINEGNVHNFKIWVEHDGDMFTPNSKGITPYRYLQLLTKRPYGLNRKKTEHKAMLSFIDEHLALSGLATLLSERDNDQY